MRAEPTNATATAAARTPDRSSKAQPAVSSSHWSCSSTTYLLPNLVRLTDRQMYEWLDTMVANRDEGRRRRRARLGRAFGATRRR